MDSSRALLAHPLAQEVQEPLAAACRRAVPGSPAEAERSRFLPQTSLGAQALPAELPMLARAGTAGGDLAQAAIPGCGSADGREGIKERRCRHLLALLAVTPPCWQGAMPLASRHAALHGAGSECGDAGGMPVVMPFPAGDRHRASAQRLQRSPGTPGGVGRGGQRVTWRIPPAPFFPEWKPGPSDA